MTRFEEIFLWIAIASYAVSFALFLNGMVFKKERLPIFGFRLSLAGFVAQTVSIVIRWVATGHAPVMHTYENCLIGIWFVMLIYLGMRFYFPPSLPFGVVITPFSLLVLGNGLLVGAELQPLEPAFRSNWLYIHVLFAWLAFGSYLVAFADGTMYLLRERARQGVMARLPELKLLEELSLRLILFGFFAQAVMIGSGAIWAHGLWGRYWGWDPVETWSLISWLVYGLNLHLRITLGWTGRRAAWLAVGSLFGIIFLFFGFGHGGSVHTEMFAR